MVRFVADLSYNVSYNRSKCLQRTDRTNGVRARGSATVRLTSDDEPDAGGVDRPTVDVGGARQPSSGVVDVRPEVERCQLDGVPPQPHAAPAARRHRPRRLQPAGHVAPPDRHLDADGRRQRDGDAAQRARHTGRVDQTSTPRGRVAVGRVARPTGSTVVVERRRRRRTHRRRMERGRVAVRQLKTFHVTCFRAQCRR